MSEKTFHVHMELTWHPNRIPPRCRKPRQVPETEQLVIDVPRYEPDEAPLVAHVRADIGQHGVDASDVRHVDGHFYARVVDYDDQPVQAGTDVLPITATHRSYSDDFATAVDQARSPYEKLVVIGEDVWHRISEPVYYAQTFGLGSNHGGTALFAGVLDHVVHAVAPSSIFSATDRAGALEGATKVAEGRGDTKSVARFRADTIEVLDPGVFKVPNLAQREGQARAQIAGLLDDASSSLTSGTVTIETLKHVGELLGQARTTMYEQGIDSLDRS